MTTTTGAESARKSVQTEVDEAKKTLVIYSPDLNFCFSLSMVFQDRYNVVTTTSLTTLEKSVSHYTADLVVVDADPSEKMIQRIDRLRESNRGIPVILLYVYNAREARFSSIFWELPPPGDRECGKIQQIGRIKLA
ncbi:MAG: hypothetical protein H6Q28_1814 [Bacteroidetes bacterium]|nr:hypothetical protein [Bacteroidota bacterium]